MIDGRSRWIHRVKRHVELLYQFGDVEKMAADIFAFADEAGLRGPVRDLRPDQDGEISLICTLPIPGEFLDAVRHQIDPLFRRFCNEAPSGAKLHITDAFKPGNEKWGAVARQVRKELFTLMHESRIIIIYVARRARLARLLHENQDKMLAAAKASKTSEVKITGGNRPNDERIEDHVMISLALMLDTFAEQEKRKRVDIRFDEVDHAVAERYRDALEVTRNVSANETTVKGWDPNTKEKVSGTISMKADAPFRLDSQYLGGISVAGKSDPLVFAVDVVANSLWRHLGTLNESANLNDGGSIAAWELGSLVWGARSSKGFDDY